MMILLNKIGGLILCFVAFCACSQQVSNTPDSSPGNANTSDGATDPSNEDASSGDGGEDASSSPFLCPLEFVEGCKAPMPGAAEYMPLLSADQFGDGVSFVRQDRNIILAQRTNATKSNPVVFVFDQQDAQTRYDGVSALPDVSFGEFILEEAGGSKFQAVDLFVVSGIDYTSEAGLHLEDSFDGPAKSLKAAFIALLCDDTGCALYKPALKSDGSSVMQPIPKGQLPKGWHAGGMFATVEDALCVFGDGIKCFNGNKWQDLPVPDDRLNDAFCQDFGGKPIAVGDNGTVRLRTTEGWKQVATADTSDLHCIHSTGSSFAAGGDEVLFLGNNKNVRVCSMPGKNIILTQTEKRFGGNDGALFYYVSIYTDTGEIYELETSATTVSACHHSTPLPSPVLGISESGEFGIQNINWFATTRDTIYIRSQWWCGEI